MITRSLAYSASFSAISLSLVLAGCSPQPESAPTSTPTSSVPNAGTQTAVQSPSPALEIDTSSPDNALKSWWRVLDHREQVTSAECAKRNIQSTPEYFPLFERVAQGSPLRQYTAMEREYCTPETFEREIQEVKTESETRAVVFAKIRNITPIPAGTDPSPEDRKNRADGYRYRYLLEKSAQGWKVSAVYRFDALNAKYKIGEPWEPLYANDSTPTYPSFVYNQ